MLQIGQTAFQGTKKLNLIQSVVFDAAYNSNENLLICAPTGAGKTNIAMLAVLHELKQHIAQGVIKTDEFKVSLCFGYSITQNKLCSQIQCTVLVVNFCVEFLRS